MIRISMDTHMSILGRSMSMSTSTIKITSMDISAAINSRMILQKYYTVEETLANVP